MDQPVHVYDVVVVGGGIVGLSILREATMQGYQCALVEAEPHLLSCASGSNSGIACTGVDAAPGTLERALIRDSISRIRPFCQQHNIPMRPCGSLVCQWAWDNDTNEKRLNDVLLESHEAGDTHASLLTPEQVGRLEPNLSTACQGAVYIPGEIVVDPWLFSVAFAVHARENGAKIFTGWKLDSTASTFDQKQQIWTLVRSTSESYVPRVDISGVDCRQQEPPSMRAKAIVNATGIMSDIVHSNIQQQAKVPTITTQWTGKPRRGQYRVFRSTSVSRVTHPIQPVPTQYSKGIFVFSTLYDQIVVGPTALDQGSRTDRAVDPRVSQELALLARKIIPNINLTEDYMGDYVGIRPGTDQRDYQIHLHSEIYLCTAAGIRSTGLTASLGIGRHVVHLIASLLPAIQTLPTSRMTPLPAVSELVQEYHDREDGCVSIQRHTYKVTHPITIFGWNAETGKNQL